MQALRYEIPGQYQRIWICPSVREFLLKFRQVSTDTKESGGQLFAKLSSNGDLTICKASGPAKGDKASVISFVINKIRGNREIQNLFREGYHYVGDWHTHPQWIPTASEMDLHSMRELFRKSKHSHNSFLMLILGTKDGPDGIWLSQHDTADFQMLKFLDSVDHDCP